MSRSLSAPAANSASTSKPQALVLNRYAIQTREENLDGPLAAKEGLIAEICSKHNCNVLSLQETHRGSQSRRPKVKGMSCIVERYHDQFGSALFVKEGTYVESTYVNDTNNIKILSEDLGNIVITSVCKPPNVSFKFSPLYQPHKNRVVLGDFNSTL